MPDRRPPRRKPEARRRAAALTRGEAIAALSAIALFVFTFLTWYDAEVVGQVREIKLGGGAGAGGNAWQTLEVLPVGVLLTVIVAVGAALLRLAGSKREPAVPLGAAIAVLGGVSTLGVLFRIIAPPDLGNLGGVPLGASVQLGAFLALAAAAGVAYGGYRAMGERGASFAEVAERLSRDHERTKRERTKVKPKRAPKPKSSRSRRPAKSSSRKQSPSSSD